MRITNLRPISARALAVCWLFGLALAARMAEIDAPGAAERLFPVDDGFADQSLAEVTPDHQVYLPLILQLRNSSRGIQGYFSVDNPTLNAGERLWFDFHVTNTTDETIPYSVLGAHIDNGPSAPSWTRSYLRGQGVLSWRDNIRLSQPGVYHVYLGICYDDVQACLANAAPWDRLSGNVTVTVK